MYHYFFAESVDIMSCTPGYGNAQRVDGGDTHCIAYAVAPQAVGGSDNHSISLPGLDLPSGQRWWKRIITMF